MIYEKTCKHRDSDFIGKKSSRTNRTISLTDQPTFKTDLFSDIIWINSKHKKFKEKKIKELEHL